MRTKFVALRALVCGIALASCDRKGSADREPEGAFPSTIDVGTCNCGTTGSGTFSLTNSGSASIEYSFTFSDPMFTIEPASGSIAAGETGSFTVTADVPPAAIAGAALTATLTAVTNLPGSPHFVPVSVTPRGAKITLTPPSVGFGQVEAGTVSQPFVVLIANSGNAPATVTLGGGLGEFDQVLGLDSSITLAPAESASATFTYSPSAAGGDTATSAITTSGPHCGAAPQAIPIEGIGEITGGVLVQGSPVDFGSVACGATSDTATVTLTNTAFVSVPFTAAFLADAEGDENLYTVVPASGSVPPDSSLPLTVTRLAVALPAQPRALDAVLRINTSLPSSTDTDVPVKQALVGPFLQASPLTVNFGFAPLGGVRTSPLSIANVGNAGATLQSVVSAPFAFQLPALVVASGMGSGTATYDPDALGSATDAPTVTAVGACSDPLGFSFQAGDGPYPVFSTLGAEAECPTGGSSASGPIAIANGGNQTLTVSCSEPDSAFSTVFTPPSRIVGPGGSNTIDAAVSTFGAPAGLTSTTVRCTTNEPLENVHDFTFSRLLDGADLVIQAPAPLDFDCFVPRTLPFSVASTPNSTATVFTSIDTFLVFPITASWTQEFVAPGESYLFSMDAYATAGSDALCENTAQPQGTVIFTGTVGIFVDAGGGPNLKACSVSAPLPVVLRAGAPF